MHKKYIVRLTGEEREYLNGPVTKGKTVAYKETGFEKNGLKPRLHRCRVIPPEQNGESVARMEDIIKLYCQPYDPEIPSVCTDGQTRQLIGETGRVIPAGPGKPERTDYEYERNGTADIFMFTGQPEVCQCHRKKNIVGSGCGDKRTCGHPLSRSRPDPPCVR